MAGLSVVNQFINSLTDVNDNSNIIVDLLGFDGWPASFALKEICQGNKWAGGTICHSGHESAFVSEIINNKVFSNARDGKLKIPGFPNFQSVISELKKSGQSTKAPEYAICTPLADGGLVIKQALIELWTTKNEGFKDEADSWLDDYYFFGSVFGQAAI